MFCFRVPWRIGLAGVISLWGCLPARTLLFAAACPGRSARAAVLREQLSVPTDLRSSVAMGKSSRKNKDARDGGGPDTGAKRPQDKGRYIHPAETSCWQEEVKHFDYKYTATFRVVPPYKFAFGTSMKARWIGRPLLEIFTQEFPYFDDSLAYYTEAIKNGRLRVNDEPAPLDYCCRDGDVVTHTVHRHEPPVSSQKVRILSDSEGLLVVDKPASVPIHPGGRYRRNSLLAILAKEHHIFDLHTVHRLDRLTSGLILLGKSKAVAEQVRKEFEAGTVLKKYLARVTGAVPGGRSVVDQPIACFSHREAIHCIRAEDGKPAQTVVTRLASAKQADGSVHSLVLCEPKTGRTHQIRLHLQWLGCPIANDPLYGPLGVGSTAVGPSEGVGEEGSRAGAEEEGGVATGAATGGPKVPDGVGHKRLEFQDADQVMGGKRLKSEGAGADSAGHDLAGADIAGEGTGGVKAGSVRLVTEELARLDETIGLDANGWFDAECVHCRAARAEGCRGYYVPAKKKHDDSTTLMIYLHALTNDGAQWSHAAPLPPWALEIASSDDISAKIPDYVPPQPPEGPARTAGTS